MKRNNEVLLITLVYRCVFVFFGICMIGSIVGAIIVFFKFGNFNFDWQETIVVALKKGGVAGLILGIGIWIKAKLTHKKSTNTDN